MLPAAGDHPTAPVSGAAYVQELHGGRGKTAPPESQTAVAPSEGGKGRKQHGLTIDINKPLHDGDGWGFAANPPAGGAAVIGPPRRSRAARSLAIKKRELEIEGEMLELEQQRVIWAGVSSRKDRELDEMRVENSRMKLENERLRVQLQRRELEVAGVKSKAV